MTQPLETTVLIGRKRDGGSLSADEVAAFIRGYLDDVVSDAQMSAWLMAGVIRGFSDEEATALTEAYVRSGDTVDLSALRGPTVDKHSTGGVGDTTTLVVSPLLAAVGCQVAKLSGRGLGHTGGTLDKLESIPGFRVDLTEEQLRSQVEDIGIAVAAATADLVPADKRIYALRDLTATVQSDVLIAASVMSKKLAGGAQHIVLDVKVGDGAFMKDLAAGRALAESCVAIGRSHGRAISALVSDMSQPLGPGIGNALEARAAIEVLAGGGSHRIRQLSLALAAEALALTGVESGKALAQVTGALDSGAGLERFAMWVERQGGDPRVAQDPDGVLPSAPVQRSWTAPEGNVRAISTTRLGQLAGRLGAGRVREGATLDPSVGIVCNLEVGKAVGDGVSVEVHAASEADADAVLRELPLLFDVTSDHVAATELLLDRIPAQTGA